MFLLVALGACARSVPPDLGSSLSPGGHAERSSALESLTPSSPPAAPPSASATAPSVARKSPELDEIKQILRTGQPTLDSANNPPACAARLNADLKPSRVWIEEYERHGASVTLRGGAIGIEDVAQLACRLSMSALFQDIVLMPGSGEAGHDPQKFELRAKSNTAGPDDEPLTRFPPPSAGAIAAFREPHPSPIPLEQLKLVGIMTGANPTAMFSDVRGLGQVLSVGDRIPRRDGGQWRVDRIDDSSVDFVADGSSTPPLRTTIHLSHP